MRAWVGVLAVAAACAACVDTPSYENRLCDPSAACPSGYACGSDYRCHRACSVNADCRGPGLACVNGACEASAVSPESGCKTAADCTSPAACEVKDGTERCDTSTGQCIYRAKACKSPPAAVCLMNDTLFRTYASDGLCNPQNGDCAYTMIDTQCTGCMANCLTPCQGVVCDNMNGGCKKDGHCVAGDPGTPDGMPHCAYTDAADLTSCTITASVSAMAKTGMCVSGLCYECSVDTDCDDHNTCTSDSCNLSTHACVHTPEAGSCDDANACTQMDSCTNGQCVGATTTMCNQPPGACYASSGACDPMSGLCQYPLKAAGSACPDDGNPCTDDLCSPTGDCTHPASATTTTCNDGNLCTSNDHCNGAGACTGTAYSCNDNNACTTDACDGNGGCTHTEIAPASLTPNNGTNEPNLSVTLRWDACPSSTAYDAEIQFYGNPPTWYPYYTYNVTSGTSQTFYPCSSTSPSPPCNSDFRFRVRAYINGQAGPWSNWSQWHWGNCHAC
jgi:hypothetical protein